MHGPIASVTPTIQEDSVIRAVVFMEDDVWVGMCLEYYIAAQGNSMDELIERLLLTIEAERQTSRNARGKAFAGIDPAPQRFHRMWEDATPMDREITDGVELALCA